MLKERVEAEIKRRRRRCFDYIASPIKKESIKS